MSEIPLTSGSLSSQPLGVVLQQAGLLVSSQLEVALRDQTQHWDLRLGEILDLRGWVKQQTSDFFADQFALLKVEPHKHPFGFYLREAALLDDDQIRRILQQQCQVDAKFGTLAVHNGWLALKTLTFLVQHFCDQPTSCLDRKAHSHFLTTTETVIQPSVSRSTTLQLNQNFDVWIG